MQGRIYREVIEAEASGPVSCMGPFKARARGPKQIFTFVPNFLFVILYSFYKAPKI